MKKILLLLAVVALLLSGCARPRMSVDPNWNVAPKKITVLVSTPNAKNSDDIYDDFMGDTEFEDWFIDFLGESFVKYSNAEVKVVYVDDNVFDMVEMPLADRNIRFPVPNVNGMEDFSDMIVSLHPVTFWRSNIAIYTNYGMTSSSSLEGDLKYTIYSQNENRVLAYGLAKDRSSFAFAMTRSNWDAMVVALVRKVLQKTPLQRR